MRKLILILALSLAACGGPSEADMQATVSAAVQATKQAQPTVAPTAAPTPAPKGLGIRRDDIQSNFAAAGFAFRSSPLDDGRERVLGEFPGNMVTIELIGSAENITEASVMTGVGASADPGAQQLSAVSQLSLIKAAAPDWAEGADWLLESTQAVTGEVEASGSGTRTETLSDRTVQLQVVSLPDGAIFTLTVKALP